MTTAMVLCLGALVVVLALFDVCVFGRVALRVEPRKGVVALLPFLGLVILAAVLLLFARQHGWLEPQKTFVPSRSELDVVLSFLTAVALATSILLANQTTLEAAFVRFALPDDRRRKILRYSILGAIIVRGALVVLILAVFDRARAFYVAAGVALFLASGRMLYSGHARRAKPPPIAGEPVRSLGSGSGRVVDLLLSGGSEPRFLPSSSAAVTAWIAGLEVFAALVATIAVYVETTDPFSMLCAHLFAVFASRSLHGPAVALAERHRYLETSIALVLAFMGVKALLAGHVVTSPVLSFAMVAGIFMVGVMASLIGGPRDLMLLVPQLDEDLAPFVHAARRTVRRAFIFAAGATLLVVGAALLFLPGPGLPTMIAGLALLATEFVWARRWMKRLLDRVRHMRDSAADFFRKERGSRE